MDAFSSISFSRIHRFDNFIVHNLAKHVRHLVVFGVKKYVLESEFFYQSQIVKSSHKIHVVHLKRSITRHHMLLSGFHCHYSKANGNIPSVKK